MRCALQAWDWLNGDYDDIDGKFEECWDQLLGK